MLHCHGPTPAPFAFRQQQAQSLTCTDARGNRRGCLRPAVATGAAPMHAQRMATACQSARHDSANSAGTCAAGRAEAAGAEAAREQLLWRIAGLQRGSAASQWDRALVAEAQASASTTRTPRKYTLSVAAANRPHCNPVPSVWRVSHPCNLANIIRAGRAGGIWR